MIRIVHRTGAVFAVLLMLWMAGTGSWIQLLDFKSILSHDPQTNPTQMSIHDGSFGPGFFVVFQFSDYTAAALPNDFDVKKGMETVLHAAGPAAAPISWIELRVANGIPIGQIMSGTKLAAFNAQTGEPVAAVPRKQFPQNSTLPYSLRQRLKVLHRFWGGSDVPGVYFEFLTGLVLFGLLITGLIMYFRLLAARAKMGRGQWFWLTGGIWRGLHRSLSVLSAVFLFYLVVTGTLIGFDNSWSAAHGDEGGKPRTITPVRAQDVPAMTATTLEAMQRLHPGMPIKAIRLRTFGEMKQAVVITGGEKADQLLFDTANGNQVSLTEPSYPKSNFPFGFQMHENFKHLHLGDMFGIPVRVMNLFGGLSLLFLSVSGIVMYLDMWSKRRKMGRKSFLWT